MSEPGGHCYCGVSEVSSPQSFTCDKCKRQFHADCLKSGLPSVLKGDFLFHFKCETCGDGEEEFDRMRLQWMQVVQLTLYNLMLGGAGMCGYFRWKEHICAFIDKHWNTFFGSHRKKTSLWHGTVAGVLSSGCPNTFMSGVHELKESGWWRLAELKPPILIKQGAPVSRAPGKKKEVLPSNTEPPKEGLRSRRGKTSIQAAMELKAKRATLMEAKEIRKSKTQRSPVDTQVSASSPSLESPTAMPLLSAHLQAGRAFPSPTPTLNSPLQPVTMATTPITTGAVQASRKIASFSGLFDSTTRKTSTSSSSSDLTQTHLSSPSSSNLSAMEQTTPPLTSSLLAEHLTSGTIVNMTSRQSSVQECLSDESSEMSQGSYLTEKDLKLPPTVPILLMTDDRPVDDSDSDFEIDPGTISPPPAGCPVRMQDSPTVQELLSTMDSESSNHYMAQLEDSHHEDSYQAVSDSFSSRDHDNSMQVTEKSTNEEEASVVDSESESESDSEVSEKNLEEGQEAPATRKRKRTSETEREPVAESVPVVRCHQMSTYEERQLLKRLDRACKGRQLPPHINRLRRKLIVRQQKRENGMPLFDLDAELNRLAQKCWGSQYGIKEKSGMVNIGQYHPGSMRVLDKFQTTNFTQKAQQQKQPSFLNRLVGTEDDQLQCVRSPYTARVLKPFIRRDSETHPLKMRLLQEIKAYPHRNEPTWKASPPPTIDYCYLRPQHIPSINALCREFFWPGIDISECLHYPDFSCVVLFRKFVVGFAFMVPDVKHNEAYISFLFTHPEWRHAGMATFMLYHLIQTCMGKDVTLHVSATNTAMLLYQKFGFKPEEFILDFYDKYYPPDSRECKHAFFLRLRR